MIDLATQKSLTVEKTMSGWPFMDVSKDQLVAVRRLLDDNKLRYWVDEHFISLDEGPYMGIINFGAMGDAEAVRALLDRIR